MLIVTVVITAAACAVGATAARWATAQITRICTVFESLELD
jgi:hypothetical protein